MTSVHWFTIVMASAMLACIPAFLLSRFLQYRKRKSQPKQEPAWGESVHQCMRCHGYLPATPPHLREVSWCPKYPCRCSNNIPLHRLVSPSIRNQIDVVHRGCNGSLAVLVDKPGPHPFTLFGPEGTIDLTESYSIYYRCRKCGIEGHPIQAADHDVTHVQDDEEDESE